ncbi:MAG: acetyl-CoA acetyltransferase [Planctomycetota bacterium]|nr:MAG: acetyl-CoA acetyltransferase [Planctomycetota bacterium]
MSREVWVLEARRTPIGRFCGALAPLGAVDLGVAAVRGLAAALAPRWEGGAAGVLREVEQTIFGVARQAGLGPNPARQIAVRAGVPVERPAWTVNMACASGLKAVALGAAAILAGEAELVLAGGTESMTNVPHLLPGLRRGSRLGHLEVPDAMYRDGFACPLAGMLMGETADLLARERGIDRARCDAWAAQSQQRCERARRSGRFAREIVPVELPAAPGAAPVRVLADEHPRDGVTPEKLAQLPPVFGAYGVTTAGNASGINDGAAAVLLAEAGWARARGLEPLARLGAWAEAALEPERMGLGPVPAVRRLLARTGCGLEAYEQIELNEAFAAQVLACVDELGLDPERVNPDGGAIALGHPIGCTGARLVTTLAHGLAVRGGRRGLVTLCVSGGLGMALELCR